MSNCDTERFNVLISSSAWHIHIFYFHNLFIQQILTIRFRLVCFDHMKNTTYRVQTGRMNYQKCSLCDYIVFLRSRVLFGVEFISRLTIVWHCDPDYRARAEYLEHSAYLHLIVSLDSFNEASTNRTTSSSRAFKGVATFKEDRGFSPTILGSSIFIPTFHDLPLYFSLFSGSSRKFSDLRLLNSLAARMRLSHLVEDVSTMFERQLLRNSRHIYSRFEPRIHRLARSHTLRDPCVSHPPKQDVIFPFVKRIVYTYTWKTKWIRRFRRRTSLPNELIFCQYHLNDIAANSFRS